MKKEVTFRFIIDHEHLHDDGMPSAGAGITVPGVAIDILKNHDARDGYIAWTVTDDPLDGTGIKRMVDKPNLPEYGECGNCKIGNHDGCAWRWFSVGMRVECSCKCADRGIDLL